LYFFTTSSYENISGRVELVVIKVELFAIVLFIVVLFAVVLAIIVEFVGILFVGILFVGRLFVTLVLESFITVLFVVELFVGFGVESFFGVGLEFFEGEFPGVELFDVELVKLESSDSEFFDFVVELSGTELFILESLDLPLEVSILRFFIY